MLNRIKDFFGRLFAYNRTKELEDQLAKREEELLSTRASIKEYLKERELAIATMRPLEFLFRIPNQDLWFKVKLVEKCAEDLKRSRRKNLVPNIRNLENAVADLVKEFDKIE